MSRNRLGINRIGLTASMALGHAVVRNRLKRVIRAAYSELEPLIGTGYDFVFVARSRAVGSGEVQIRRDMKYSFGKLGLLEQKSKEDR
jgi:ribonuclease P protein component